MTPEDLSKQTDDELTQLFAWLWADSLPVGKFNGFTWPISVRPFWRGKVFYECGHVLNRIGPWLLVQGDVTFDATQGEAVIDYGHGITDGLRPVSEKLWLGQLRIGGLPTFWFALEQA